MNKLAFNKRFTTTLLFFVITSLIVVAIVSCAKIDDEFNTQTTEEITSSEGDVYNYELPVIFHVLYSDVNSATQNVPQSRLEEILENVNLIYDGEYGGEDINLTFYLADKDESGATLSEPGVNYVHISGTYPLDCEEVLEGTEYKSILWDPNSYINVLVFNFADESILGVSHLPFMYYGSKYALDGVNISSYSSLGLENLKITYCSAINSTYINVESDDYTYREADINCTLAHELGHYLGLLHVFSEEEDGSDDDTDYCDDTPSYNRNTYYEYLIEILSNPFNKVTFFDMILRTNSRGESYDSDNTMDYAYSYTNVLTADQSSRIRTVLQYALMIPGPKVTDDTKSVNIPDGIVDIPYTIVHCELNKELCCSH